MTKASKESGVVKVVVDKKCEGKVQAELEGQRDGPIYTNL